MPAFIDKRRHIFLYKLNNVEHLYTKASRTLRVNDLKIKS